MQKFIPTGQLDYDEVDSSYALRWISVFQDDHVVKVKILLPATDSVDQLVEARNEAAKNDADRHSELQFELAEALRAAAIRPSEPPAPYASLAKKKKADRLIVEDARADLKLQFDEQAELLQALEPGQRTQVQVYAWDEPLNLLTQSESSADEKLRERDTLIFEQLKKRGAFRQIGNRCASDRALDGLRCLRSSQPHFSEVIDFIEGQVLVAQELETVQHIPPILIVGPPGVGKTHFTLDLARALERVVHRHSFDSSHTADSLTGGDRHWSNSEVGLVFRAICLSDRGDPLILLDEIDKAISYRSGNPLAPLHSLLEPVTANAIKDISAGIQFDASHISWVATANYLELVPPTIQSRFRVFQIQLPSAAQSIELAHNVAVSVHDRFTGFAAPSRRVVTQVAHLSPREMVQVLEQAFGRALLNGRKHLVLQDLPPELMDADGNDAPRAHHLH